MAVAFGRAKRITNLLDEKVRARLRGDGDDIRFHNDHGGYTSSGSDHDGASALSGLLDGFFFEEDESLSTTRSDATIRSTNDDASVGRRSLSPAMIRSLMNRPVDRFRTQLTADVTKAVEKFGALRRNKPSLRRAVMGFLRDSGHNAGVCKSKWEGSSGVTTGNYEYIDVLKPCSGERYIIDLDFSAEFEIARATEEYQSLIEELPVTFVGRTEELNQAVRFLAEAAKRSMRSRGMNLPPWRKAKYMQNKWSGPYKRTTNAAAAAEVAVVVTATPTPFVQGREVQYCREVGFSPAGHVMIPTARMR